MQFVLKSQQCEAWPQPLHKPFTITLIYLEAHLCDGVLSIFPIVTKIIVSTQNNHQMCCFSSMRYNQTINSQISVPLTLQWSDVHPWLPGLQRTLDDQHYSRSQACFPATYSLMISWERFCASSVRPAVLLNQCTAARSNLLQEAGPSRAYSFTHWLAERDVFAHWSVHTSISCLRWARPESTRGTVEYR